MSIAPFGILLILFFTVFFIWHRKKPIEQVYKYFYILNIVSLLVLDLGQFMVLGSFIVEYNYVFSIISLILAFLVLFRGKARGLPFKLPIAFLIVIIAGIALTFVLGRTYKSVGFGTAWDPYFESYDPLPNVGISMHSLMILARSFIFLFCFSVFASVSRFDDIVTLMKVVYRVSIVVIFLSLLETVISNAISPLIVREWGIALFGSSSATYYLPRVSFGIFTPMLFMREPSSYCYACFLFGANALALGFVGSARIKKKVFVVFAIFALLLLLSGSLSGFIYLAVLVIVLFVLTKKKALFLSLAITIGVVGLILVSSLYGSRIEHLISGLSLIFTNEPSAITRSSEIIRIYSWFNNIRLFLSHPLLGCGLGTVYSYSGIGTLLSNVGLLGTLLFALSVSQITNRYFNTQRFSFFSLFIVVLAHLITGHVSYLLYLDRIALLFLVLKYVDLVRIKGIRRKALPLKTYVAVCSLTEARIS